MTIDERIEALTMNVELLSRNQEAIQAAQREIHTNHEEMQQDIKILLGSQVSISGSLEKLTGRMAELAAAQRLTDQRMDALILTVDEIIRNGGPKA